MWSMYTVGYYSAVKKNEILPFTATWMDLEGIMLSEISQIKTNTILVVPSEEKKEGGQYTARGLRGTNYYV